MKGLVGSKWNVRPYHLEGDEETRLKIERELGAFPRAVLCHAALTELECRVEPLRSGKLDLLGRYERLFAARHTRRLPLTDEVYRLVTGLRALHRLKTPAALHLAAALSDGCEAFWTRDDRLSRAAAGRIQLIVPV
jgi:predicted nucleic acid-binding protein